jgi:hypothetical protein
MARIEEQIEIAAAPADVFRFCHDVERWSEWDERVVGVELLSGTPVRRGTLIRVDAGRGGRFRFCWDAEFAEFQYPRSSALQVLDAAPSSAFKTGRESREFSSLSSPGGGTHGTRLTLVWTYEPRGVLHHIADALGGRAATRRVIQRSLVNLKRIIEAG